MIAQGNRWFAGRAEGKVGGTLRRADRGDLIRNCGERGGVGEFVDVRRAGDFIQAIAAVGAVGIGPA